MHGELLVTTPTTAEPTILGMRMHGGLLVTTPTRARNKMGGHADAYRHLTGKVKYMLSYELSVKWITVLMGC
jgi:hypothetical protein